MASARLNVRHRVKPNVNLLGAFQSDGRQGDGMFANMRQKLVETLFTRRDRTEVTLRQLWERDSGGWNWDEVIRTYGVTEFQTKNLFDVLDERLGEELHSAEYDVRRKAAHNCLAAMMRQVDAYCSAHEQRLLSRY